MKNADGQPPVGGAVVIEQVETMLVDLPTIRPHKLSMATMNGQTLMLVRVRCSDGTMGIGEGTTIGGLAYGAESPEGMKLAIDTYFAPLMMGADASRVPALMARLNTSIRDNRFAKCAVETALFDALGHRTGLPVSELLGGRQRDRLPVAWTLASGDTGRDIDEARRMLELRRHKIFKLKIGRRSVQEDVEHVAAIKKAQGQVGADAQGLSQSYSMPDEPASKTIERLGGKEAVQRLEQVAEVSGAAEALRTGQLLG